jgi:predicted O-linked N-acetylglucosamine transferase (SPINDLY family)
MDKGRQPANPPLQTSGAEPMLKLRQAIGLHRQDRLLEAERLYRDVLAHSPDQPDALHFLGVLEGQRANYHAALKLMDRALTIHPRNAAVLYNRANTLRDMGRPEAALAGYEAALAVNPGNIAALNNHGIVLLSLQRHGEAVASYDRALAINPDHADSHANRGNALVELGRCEDALASFERALANAPDHIGALYGTANAFAKLGRYEEAIGFYDRVLPLARDNPQILTNRGNALCQLSRYDEALASLDRAIAAAPNDSKALSNRGKVFMQLRRYDQALADYDRTLASNSDHPSALYGRGSALVELKRHDEAIAAFERLLQKQPDYPYGLGMLVHAQKTCCDWRDGSAAKAMTAAIRAGKRVATPMVLLATSDSPADKLRCAQILMQDKYKTPAHPLYRGERYRHDRIRIAYLSADFRIHPVAILMAGVFEHHDRARFETIAISHGLDDASEMRGRLTGSFERFFDVQGKSDKEVASLIRDMEADIAIDLTGLTGNGRPGILSLRPAPVQVNYLGYASSLGCDRIDYILVDRIVIPDEHHAFYTEKIAYLPDTYMPHDSRRSIAERAPSRAEFGLPEQGFVFASFNNSYKFGPEVFDVWMRLLVAIEGSVLWLPSANTAAMRNLRREAEQRGVAAERLVFASHMPAAEDHLARLALADLFLDTLPYNAHTTAMDALWAGLPVLTCTGNSFAGRVATSLLHAAGLPELVADSLAAYEALALNSARDPSVLAAIRAKLRRNRNRCALFDTERFTRNLEAAYGTMWERAQRGESPESFAVEAGAPS